MHVHSNQSTSFQGEKESLQEGDYDLGDVIDGSREEGQSEEKTKKVTRRLSKKSQSKSAAIIHGEIEDEKELLKNFVEKSSQKTQKKRKEKIYKQFRESYLQNKSMLEQEGHTTKYQDQVTVSKVASKEKSKKAIESQQKLGSEPSSLKENEGVASIRAMQEVDESHKKKKQRSNVQRSREINTQKTDVSSHMNRYMGSYVGSILGKEDQKRVRTELRRELQERGVSISKITRMESQVKGVIFSDIQKQLKGSLLQV